VVVATSPPATPARSPTPGVARRAQPTPTATPTPGGP
jgi:hypothetical protein